jgi:glutamine synthetase
MTGFAERCGLATAARDRAVANVVQQIDATGIELVRFTWCDVHGVLRSKTLVAAAVAQVMHNGVGMVSTLLLKDTSNRTAYKVFEAGGTKDLPGFEYASNVLLMAEPESYLQLPWAPGTGWLRTQPFMQDGTPIELDTRRVLQRALQRLATSGYGLKCGLEVEFHIYRIEDTQAQLDPEQAAWPGLPPRVSMIHPGYNLLADSCYDMADEPMRIVLHTAQSLGMPLLSLEIELGPSQVEAVFEATDALTAADNMVLFRNAVRQALLRAGYYATFMCRPPFPNIMSSGWHLHQSLVELSSGNNAFRRESPAEGSDAMAAQHVLSETGEYYLAGLLKHARGMAVFCTPTPNGFARFQPNALAPQSVLWGRDNRGAMLRVVGECNDNGTRIENRVGEPTANPYLYIAAQIHAGMNGIERQLRAPPATDSPYSGSHELLPKSLGEALEALDADVALCTAFGQPFVDYYTQLKRLELSRFDAAQDKTDFERREYFGRI